MKSRYLYVIVTLLLPACAGGSDGSDESLSGKGESCTKTADCESGLKCVDLVCVQVEDSGGEDVRSEDETTACQADCSGKQCGDDGCGGSCGTCTGCGEECRQSACEFTACEGNECGSDTCGGTCGSCDEVQEECSMGLCVCSFVNCDDVCCAAGQVCAEGACCSAVCEGMVCGPDGCGGTCGSCDKILEEYSKGLCVCSFADCSEDCCDAGQVCAEGSCCSPDCDGKMCGPDGCGVNCGSCSDEYICESGQCKSVLWTDPTSGLVWQNPSTGDEMDWDEATQSCADSDLGGHTDWRLPTIGELRSLIRGCPPNESGGICSIEDGDCLALSCLDDSCSGCSYGDGPADGCYWPDELQGTCSWTWTSSAVEEVQDDVDFWWSVVFGVGAITEMKASQVIYARCVRDAL